MAGKFQHGHATGGKWSRTYTSWVMMIQRCTNPKATGFKDYGGRGIKVCRRWLKFNAFLQDMGTRPEKQSLERVNNSKGYSKANCKWATKKDQQRNKRDSVFIEHNGARIQIDAASERLNCNRAVIRGRMRLGWTGDRIMTTPVRERKKPNGII